MYSLPASSNACPQQHPPSRSRIPGHLLLQLTRLPRPHPPLSLALVPSRSPRPGHVRLRGEQLGWELGSGVCVCGVGGSSAGGSSAGRSPRHGPRPSAAAEPARAGGTPRSGSISGTASPPPPAAAPFPGRCLGGPAGGPEPPEAGAPRPPSPPPPGREGREAAAPLSARGGVPGGAAACGPEGAPGGWARRRRHTHGWASGG